MTEIVMIFGTLIVCLLVSFAFAAFTLAGRRQ